MYLGDENYEIYSHFHSFPGHMFQQLLSCVHSHPEATVRNTFVGAFPYGAQGEETEWTAELLQQFDHSVRRMIFSALFSSSSPGTAVSFLFRMMERVLSSSPTAWGTSRLYALPAT